MTQYAGIDYSLGAANTDIKTGIRYGIISAHDLAHWLYDEVEEHYTPRCPKCGNDAEPINDVSIENIDCQEWEEAEYDCIEFACPGCKYLFGESAYGDEPDAQIIDSGGVEGHVDSSCDNCLTRFEGICRTRRVRLIVATLSIVSIVWSPFSV